MDIEDTIRTYEETKAALERLLEEKRQERTRWQRQIGTLIEELHEVEHTLRTLYEYRKRTKEERS